ncbi:acyloxyacyl hydrolase [Petrachloros mirabilis]
MAIILTEPPVDGFGRSGFHNEPSRPITLIRVGPRLGLSGRSPFGRDQREYFQQYDVVALFGLPWGWRERTSGAKLDMRLLSSAGQLAAAADTGLMVTVVPCLAISSPEEMISVDFGGGAAFFSNYRYGSQDFGGPAQIVGTGGIGLNLIPGFYAGYRFQHFSDAGAYGPTSLGVDMHMLELNYRF